MDLAAIVARTVATGFAFHGRVRAPFNRITIFIYLRSAIGAFGKLL